jgi:hypothetical protein
MNFWWNLINFGFFGFLESQKILKMALELQKWTVFGGFHFLIEAASPCKKF